MKLRNVCSASVITLSLGVVLTFLRWRVAGASPGGPRVCIKDGCLLGSWLLDGVNSPYAAFMGIPYAKPPVDRLRFANPQPADPWDFEYNATVPKGSCIQKVAIMPDAPTLGAEDCLYLNVYTPKAGPQPSAWALPVMVYIHGGGFAFGSAELAQRDPARFMSTGRVVLVTVNFRLGVFGFLSTGDRSAAGNFGMKDQVLALRWVRRSIRAFGGDPHSVTLFGESSGGASTQLHLLSPLSRGLFQRAISMSGSALSIWSTPLEDPLALARAQARAVGITNADTICTMELVERLRAVDEYTLVNSIDSLKLWDIHPFTLYHPVVEPRDESEPFLVEDPSASWRRGDYASVPWMTGCIMNDGSVLTQTIYRNRSLIADLDSKFTQLLPLIMRANITPAKFEKLRQRFLNNTPSDKWLTEQNYIELTRLFSEGWFLYPMVKSVKQHLRNQKRTPTSVYSFQFQGRYSFSRLLSGTATRYGLTHPDELIYLFRMPLFFPEFPPGSPEAEMSQVWVKFFVDFATKTSAERTGSCTVSDCDVVTFANTNNAYFPVRKTTVSGLDEAMYGFWKMFLEQ